MELLLKVIPAIVVAVILILIVTAGYVKAPPDTAFVISGFRKKRILVGKAGIRIPFLERLDRLSLSMMSVDVKTTDFVPNAEYINVKVDATVKIRISQEPSLIELAMANFLNDSDTTIVAKVQDTLEGNMREIIGQMRLDEMVTDRKAFGERVQENAIPDLGKMGLELVSFNVQSFADQNDVINDLGIDNVSKIKKGAAISKAQADRDIAIARSSAEREANDAEVEARKIISEKQNELAIRQAELKQEADVKKAIGDAAYRIQEQEQQKSIETATVNAQIAKAERETELRAREVEIKKNALNAEICAQADAERYKQEKGADADLYKRKKDAEAKRYESEQEAEAQKKQAEAIKYAKEQEAAGVQALGEAEAAAIKAKALAEAEGIDKKAEAMQKYSQAAVIEIIMKAMPEIARNVAEPLSKVDKITMYGEGNSAKLIQDIVNGTTQVTEGMTAGLGIDLKALVAGFLGGKASSSALPAVSAGTNVNPPPAPAVDNPDVGSDNGEII